MSIDEAFEALNALWIKVVDPEGEDHSGELLNGLVPEAILLERSNLRDNRFRMLTPEEA